MSKTSYVSLDCGRKSMRAWGEHANCILLVVRQEWKPLHHCDQSCNAIPKHHGRYCSTQILCYLLIWKHTDARARFFTDIHGHRRAIHTHIVLQSHTDALADTHTSLMSRIVRDEISPSVGLVACPLRTEDANWKQEAGVFTKVSKSCRSEYLSAKIWSSMMPWPHFLLLYHSLKLNLVLQWTFRVVG